MKLLYLLITILFTMLLSGCIGSDDISTVISNGTGNQNLSQVLAVGNSAANKNINLTNGTLYINDQSVDKLIFHYVVPNNTSWINVSGLNITKDGFYDITLQLSCRVVVNDLNLYVNNDLNASNYTREFVYADGTVITAFRQNSPGISACDPGYSSVGKLRIVLDSFGKTHYISETGLMTDGRLIFFNGMYSYDVYITNINILSFGSNTIDGIGWESELWIYRS